MQSQEQLAGDATSIMTKSLEAIQQFLQHQTGWTLLFALSHCLPCPFWRAKNSMEPTFLVNTAVGNCPRDSYCRRHFLHHLDRQGSKCIAICISKGELNRQDKGYLRPCLAVSGGWKWLHIIGSIDSIDRVERDTYLTFSSHETTRSRSEHNTWTMRLHTTS